MGSSSSLSTLSAEVARPSSTTTMVLAGAVAVVAEGVVTTAGGNVLSESFWSASDTVWGCTMGRMQQRYENKVHFGGAFPVKEKKETDVTKKATAKKLSAAAGSEHAAVGKSGKCGTAREHTVKNFDEGRNTYSCFCFIPEVSVTFRPFFIVFH